MESAPEPKAATAAAPSCPASAASAGIDRRVLYAGVGIAVAAGLFLGWEWLVTVGLSALVISLLPCLVMCALGVCAMQMRQSETSAGDKPCRATGARRAVGEGGCRG